MKSLFKSAQKQTRQAADRTERWFSAVSGIVVKIDDPENQHRIKCVIPSIDEHLIYDEWIRPMPVCLGDRRGSVFVPPLGAEVILFGTLGEKYNLFYAGALYSEEMALPDEFDIEQDAGFHVPKNFKIIADLLLKLQAKNAEIIADLEAKIEAQNLLLKAANEARIEGNQIKLNGSAITLNGDGTITIEGGAVSINGDNVTICGRTVLKNGQPI